MANHECKGSTTETDGVIVEVQPSFAPEYSGGEGERYVFSYQVTITNTSDQSVRLISRHWIFVDDAGQREDVVGEGVVGEQPTIEPGESYEYQSYCPLPTRWGTMEGSFQMERDDIAFEAKIGRSYLVAPTAVTA